MVAVHQRRPRVLLPHRPYETTREEPAEGVKDEREYPHGEEQGDEDFDKLYEMAQASDTEA